MADTSGPSRSRLLASLSSRRPISTSSQGHARPIGIAGRAPLVALGFECRGDDAPHVDVVLGQQHDGAYAAPPPLPSTSVTSVLSRRRVQSTAQSTHAPEWCPLAAPPESGSPSHSVRSS